MIQPQTFVIYREQHGYLIEVGRIGYPSVWAFDFRRAYQFANETAAKDCAYIYACAGVDAVTVFMLTLTKVGRFNRHGEYETD